MAAPVLPPLEWRPGEVHLEVAFQGMVRAFRFQGPFARLGSSDRCEIKIPHLGAPVSAYLQIGNGYLAIVELSTTVELPRGEVQYLLPGGSIWLLSNARLTLESIRLEPNSSEAFSWESFDLEELRELPNSLVLESVQSKPDSKENQFRLISAISVLGTHAACQLQLKHRSVAAFQCVLFRGEHVGQPVRVVDLLAPIPTQVDGRIANGEVLNVGSRMQCGKMVFSAKRLFYDAPAGYVSSLPGMEKLKKRASEDGRLQPEIVLQDGMPAADVPGMYSSWPNALWSHPAGDVSTPSVLHPHSGQAMHTSIGSGAASQSNGPAEFGDPTLGESSDGDSNAAVAGLAFAAQKPAGIGDRVGHDLDALQVMVLPPTPWEESIERRHAGMASKLEALAFNIEIIGKSLDELQKWTARMPSVLEECLTRANQASKDESTERWLIAIQSELDRRMERGGAGQPVAAEDSRSTQAVIKSPAEVRDALAALARSALSKVALPFANAPTTGKSGLPESSSIELLGAKRAVAEASGRVATGDVAKEGPRGAGVPSEPSPRGNPIRENVVGPNPGGDATSKERVSEPTNAAVSKAHIPQPSTPGAARSSKKSRRRQSRLANRSPSPGLPLVGNREHHPVEGRTALISGESGAPKAEGGHPSPERSTSAPSTAALNSHSESGSAGRSQVSDWVGRRSEVSRVGKTSDGVSDADRLLAANESPEETLVLGSLMGLRQKKEDVRWLRLKLTMAVGAILMAVVSLYAWERIPEGWRNLIWESLTHWFSRDPSVSGTPSDLTR